MSYLAHKRCISITNDKLGNKFLKSQSYLIAIPKRFPKPGDADAGTFHSDWELAKKGGIPLPKTTFSNLYNFFLEVDEAWHQWYQANKILAHSGVDDKFTYFAMLRGIQVTGFFYEIRSTSQFRLRTAFVEASWF
jgi:hypothetical protein